MNHNRAKEPKNIYIRGATKELREIIERLSQDTEESLSLASELAAARALAERSLHAFDVTHFGDGRDKVDDETKIAIRNNLRESLTHVSNIMAQHAKVQALSEGMFSADQVHHISVQITKILERWLLPNHKEVFETVLRELDKLKVRDKPTINITIGG